MEQKILIVDDDPGILKSLTVWLEKQGFIIEGAENGKTAMTKLNNFKPDLIISDMRMPEMDGVEFMKSLKDGDGFFPGKIIFTAFDDSEALKLSHIKDGGIFRVVKDRWEIDLPTSINRAIELGRMRKEAWMRGEEQSRIESLKTAVIMLGHQISKPVQDITSGNEDLIKENGIKEGNRTISRSIDELDKVTARLLSLYD